LPAFGDYSPAEMNLKECSFDKNADAIILLDEAVSDHDEEYRLVTRRRIRIKIFNQREIDRGNIRIRFYSKDQFEFISEIRGITFNQEGSPPLISYLGNKSIFTEKEDNIFSSIKFALPNVRPGSIIEYEYTSTMKHYGGLSDWEFQNDIPTLKSCYRLTLLPNTQFQYSVQKKINYPIVIKPMPDEGRIYFEMNNIPGLKFEPYMDAIRDYLQKVEFQLAGFTRRTGGTTKVTQTWKDLAYELGSDRDFGGVIKKDLPKMDEIKNLVAKETTDPGKVAAIYNYVRNSFTWNGYHAIHAREGLKNAWEKRRGHAAEINLVLINLLQAFNIEVYPLLVAERNYGKIDTAYPFLDRFNKVVAYAIAGDKTFILDATQKYSTPDLIPYSLLNTIAFLVNKKQSMLIRIASENDTYKNVITATANVDDKGLLSGTAIIESSGYAKLLRTEKARTDVKKFIKDILQDPGSELVVDNCVFGNLDIDSGALLQKIEFHDELDVSGGFIFLTYNLFTGFAKNPFTASERFTNINFGYPYDITLKVNLQLPEKCKIDKLPADKKIISSDKTTSASRKLKIENNVLVATIEFWQTVTLVGYEYYDSVKSLYKQVVDLFNEPVVIKIAN
jgi:hypothetical protein